MPLSDAAVVVVFAILGWESAVKPAYREFRNRRSVPITFSNPGEMRAALEEVFKFSPEEYATLHVGLNIDSPANMKYVIWIPKNMLRETSFEESISDFKRKVTTTNDS